MTAQEIVTARAKLHIPTRMRVRHQGFGVVEVDAYSKEQAELMAANIWKAVWMDICDQMTVSVLMHQGIWIETKGGKDDQKRRDLLHRERPEARADDEGEPPGGGCEQ